jgi:hypothetical protein
MHPNTSTRIALTFAAVAAFSVVRVFAGADGQAPKAKTQTASPLVAAANAAKARSAAVKQDAAKASSRPKAATTPQKAPTVAHKPTPAPSKSHTSKKITSAKAQPPRTKPAPKAKVDAHAKRPEAAPVKPERRDVKAAKPKNELKRNDRKEPVEASRTKKDEKKSSTAAMTWTPTNPVAERLSTKSNLLAKARAALPPNTDLNKATAGFKNFGQFIAAMNASKNLGIPFADLKATMTGVTLAGEPSGKPVTSLGGAIRLLRADVDPMGEAQRATAQAEVEIGDTPVPKPANTAGPSTSTSAVAGGARTPKKKAKPVAQSAATR